MDSLMHAADPFNPTPRSAGHIARFVNAMSATAIVKCWPLLVFFSGWATAVAVISHNVHDLGIQSTLLTVIGTVLGFVVSYRTTSSFERYNEGRRLWSQIVLGSRTFARTIWFHVPDTMAGVADDKASAEERKARVVIEKKTVINLVEAFAVAVKHYLRGEEGVYYIDLYHLVKFLPSYALPAGFPSMVDVGSLGSNPDLASGAQQNGNDYNGRAKSTHSGLSIRVSADPALSPSLASPRAPASPPMPPTSPSRRTTFVNPPMVGERRKTFDAEKGSLGFSDEGFLLPARMPPKYHLLDLFPLSLLVKALTKRGKEVKGKTAARLRAKLRSKTVTHNLPLEISLYLSSYIAALQTRKALDPPTSTALLNALNQLVDALTGLERILTTPIPFSYRVHLWTVTILYCLLLPFQIWPPLGWLTIPATTLLSFIFFGFLVAGEEIENPFGYDKNDLNMDHFTHNIIRTELRAITALPAPDPKNWAFAPSNDLIFARGTTPDERTTPEEWLQRGLGQMQAALATV